MNETKPQAMPEDVLNHLLTMKKTLDKMVEDIYTAKPDENDFPLVSIGPSGIGGRYNKEIKP